MILEVLKTTGPADFKCGFKLTKICMSNRAKQNIELFQPVLFILAIQTSVGCFVTKIRFLPVVIDDA